MMIQIIIAIVYSRSQALRNLRPEKRLLDWGSEAAPPPALNITRRENITPCSFNSNISVFNSIVLTMEFVVVCGKVM